MEILITILVVAAALLAAFRLFGRTDDTTDPILNLSAYVNQGSMLAMTGAPELAYELAQQLPQGQARDLIVGTATNYLFRQGEEQRALEMYAELGRESKQRALEAMLQECIERDTPEHALEILERTAMPLPEPPLLRATLCWMQGQQAEALALLDAFAGRDDLEASSLIDLAKAQRLCQQPESAEYSLGQAHRILQSQPQERYLLDPEHLQLAQQYAALGLYQRIVEQAEHLDADHRGALINLLFEHEQDELAFGLLAGLPPNQMRYSHQRAETGEILLRKGNLEAAHRLAWLTPETPDDDILLALLKRSASEESGEAEVERRLQELSDRPKLLADLLVGLGRELAGSQPQWAQRLWQQAEQLVDAFTEGDERTWFLLHLLNARISAAVSDSQQLEAWLAQSQQLTAGLGDEDRLSQYLLHARQQRALGEPERAKQCLDKALALFRHGGTAEDEMDSELQLLEIAQAYLDGGHPQEALALLGETEQPSQTTVDDLLSQILQHYLSGERFAEALDVLPRFALTGIAGETLEKLYNKVLEHERNDPETGRHVRERLLAHLTARCMA